MHTESDSHLFHCVQTAQTDVQFVGIIHDRVQVSVRTQQHVLGDDKTSTPGHHKVLIGRLYIRGTRHFSRPEQLALSCAMTAKIGKLQTI